MNLKEHDDATIAYCHKHGIVYEGYDVMKARAPLPPSAAVFAFRHLPPLHLAPSSD